MLRFIAQNTVYLRIHQTAVCNYLTYYALQSQSEQVFRQENTK